jgi:hypothetical protein
MMNADVAMLIFLPQSVGCILRVHLGNLHMGSQWAASLEYTSGIFAWAQSVGCILRVHLGNLHMGTVSGLHLESTPPESSHWQSVGCIFRVHLGNLHMGTVSGLHLDRTPRESSHGQSVGCILRVHLGESSHGHSQWAASWEYTSRIFTWAQSVGFFEYSFLYLYTCTVATYLIMSVCIFQVRQLEIQKLLRISRDKQTILASLLSPDITYKPFNVSELSFDVISPFCTVK